MLKAPQLIIYPVTTRLLASHPLFVKVPIVRFFRIFLFLFKNTYQNIVIHRDKYHELYF